VGLVAALVLLLVRSSDFAESLELDVVDLRTRAFAGERGPDPRILLAQIEDEDVEALDRSQGIEWPWHLDVNAGIFRVLAAAGARAVVVDVMQLDRGAGPDDVHPGASPHVVAQQRRVGQAGYAEEFGSALVEVGRTALAFTLAREPTYEVEARVKAALTRLAPPGLWAPPDALARPHAALPVRRVLEGATWLGFATVPLDVDDVRRRAAVVGRWGDRTVLSLPLAGALLATDGTLEVGEDRVRVGGVTQRLMPDSTFLLNFRGPARSTYPRVRPWLLYEWSLRMDEAKAVPEEAKKALEGKVVVWGMNIVGNQDVVATPVSSAHDGPEVVATAIDDLLHGDGRVRAPPLANALLVLGVALLVGLAGTLWRWKGAPHVAAAIAAPLVVAAAFLVFARGTSLDLLTPLAAVVLTWGGVTALLRLTEGRYNLWLEDTFSRYLAPSVIDALKENPALLDLGGRRREVTVLFSDVAGFTKLSEALSPEQVVALLNEHLTAHCTAVLDEGGVVDKYIGDAVVAFYGDPIPQPDHAVRACRTALRVIENLPSLRPVWERMGLSDFQVRLGLNSGTAVVGNMGSRQRFDYTCMGDTVNLASRLEGANKAFGSSILLGARTLAAAKDAIVTKPIGEVAVAGREEPVTVHELLAMREGAPPEVVAHADAFRKAQDAARAGDLAAARAALDEAERRRPGDGPVRWFRGVLDAMAAGKEPTPWSGVVRLKEK
jgi:adenylate cyclase